MHRPIPIANHVFDTKIVGTVIHSIKITSRGVTHFIKLVLFVMTVLTLNSRGAGTGGSRGTCHSNSD